MLVCSPRPFGALWALNALSACSALRSDRIISTITFLTAECGGPTLITDQTIGSQVRTAFHATASMSVPLCQAGGTPSVGTPTRLAAFALAVFALAAAAAVAPFESRPRPPTLHGTLALGECRAAHTHSEVLSWAVLPFVMDLRQRWSEVWWRGQRAGCLKTQNRAPCWF